MIGRLLDDRRSRWTERYPPPETPWTELYVERHRALLCEALDDPKLRARFESRQRLPRGYGRGFDERVVEYPWLLAQRPSGRTLDAGSTLNHAHVLDRFLPLLASPHIVTLAPEAVSFPERGVSYVYADLRELPYRDALFDTVVCVSTLEHVGMDNAAYGADEGRAADPDRELLRVLAELRRVVRADGRLLVTIPYGRAEDHGWFRQLDRNGVERLVELASPRRYRLTVFRYGESGWQRSDLEGAADAQYRDYTRDPAPVDDQAAAARAVVCLALDL
ncbi:MAG: methyltransferase domain-containing protein [Actinobacteria bacterium]|nr:methyltransferase domain-containing protein [Actinomycetota bacterium]